MRRKLIHSEGEPSEARPAGRAGLSERGCWPEAVADFLLEVQQTREAKTHAFYKDRLRQLTAWAAESRVPLADFRARHLRQYLAFRATCTVARTGLPVSEATRRHDAITASVFLKFCRREGYVEGNVLADYVMPKAAKKVVACPTEAQVAAVLRASVDRWKPSVNPAVRYVGPGARAFFSRRNHAILAALVDTGARISEVLELRVEDLDTARRRMTFRNAKGDEDRTVPYSLAYAAILADWLRARPKAAACPCVFLTEYDTPIDPHRFRLAWQKDLATAGAGHLTLHQLRHYALTQMAKVDVLAAQRLAGHKSLSVTQGYVHTDEEHVQAKHAEAAPLGRLLVNKRVEARRKKIT